MKTAPSAGSVIGNCAALIALVLGAAFALDWLGRKLGYQPTVTCGILDTVSLLAATTAMVIGTIGAATWLLSGMKDGSALALLAGAIFIGVLPGGFVQYLGRISAISCV